MTYDIAIVGAGMAGASLAAAIGGRARVAMLEAEAQPGYHATGRSAAFWSETYGGPAVQPLTSASGGWLAEGGFLRPRGALHVADGQGEAALEALRAAFEGTAVVLEAVDRAGIEARLPGARPDFAAGLWEPSCADIDVGALHAHYLRVGRDAGAVLRCDAGVRAIARDGGGWRLTLPDGELRARVLVNAAGAWAGAIARMAGAASIAIVPRRRTVVQLRIVPPAPPTLPLVIDAAGRFYFKPEPGGRLWLSPHDETPVPPGDVAAEEIDVARAIDRLQQAVDWQVGARERAWAGLRSFAPDRVPVYGFDAGCPGFFWFAGQGGFGIQTAPAAAALGAALLLDDPPDPAIDAERYAPARFSA